LLDHLAKESDHFLIPISLNYCPLVRVKIIQGCVALNPNSQLLLN